jgi:hypothetical protein
MDTKSRLQGQQPDVRFLSLRKEHVWYVKAAKPELCSNCRRLQPEVCNRETVFIQSSLPSNAMHPYLRSRPNAAIIDGVKSEEKKSNFW